ncbi:tensin-2-like isoform X2 [Centruroides vittatus]|uniref:tensin-2-like isoform X2 n=1 Tax=Centruroides vittatus TaxID=120091 RepID=UPI003510243B
MKLEEKTWEHYFLPAGFRRPRSCDFCKRMLRDRGHRCAECLYCCHPDCRPKVIAPCSPSSVRSQTSSSSDEFSSFGDPPEARPWAMEVAYLSDRIVLLWFPETGSNVVHASDLRELARSLDAKHGNNYMVFNLSERKNDLTLFGAQVLEFGWPPGLAPPLQRLCGICKAVDTWLVSDPKSVVVLHSKGDKGRLGTVVSAYLRYTDICSPSEWPPDATVRKNFHREKLLPHMSSSQKRYVHYFSGLLSGSIKINNGSVFLRRIAVHGVPSFEAGGGYKPFFKIYQGMQHVFTTATFYVSPSARRMTVDLEPSLPLYGDVLVKCYHSASPPAGRSPVFRVQFHTCTLDSDRLLFRKDELDDADGDFRFPADGRVELHFSRQPDAGSRDASSLPVPRSDGGRDPLSSWDSYENFDSFPDNAPIIKKETQLDELLDDMIREIHSISDLGRGRPFSELGKNLDYGRPRPASAGIVPTAVVSVNGNRQVLSSPGRRADDEEDKPYHARKNCAPFSYGVTPGSPVLQRKFLRPASPPAADRRWEMEVSPSRPSREDSSEDLRSEDPDSRNWLQKQQEKLKARKEGKVWEDKHRRERKLMDEFRSTRHRKSPERQDEFPPPDSDRIFKDLPVKDYSTPLHVNVYDGRMSSPPSRTAKPPICRGSSAPSSPLLPSRGSSREATRNRYQQWQSGGSPPVRQKSDTWTDRERPFVSVKRAHQAAKERVADGTASPHRIVGSSLVYPEAEGLWAEEPKPERSSVSPTSSQLDELERSLQALAAEGPVGGPSSPVPRAHSTPLKNVLLVEEVSGRPPSSTGGGTPPASPPGGDRPVTPSFPVHPGTPYFHQDNSASGSGRPPKSPSPVRKDATPRTLHRSLPDVTGGRLSPVGDSPRNLRSSVSSLTEPTEVLHHHPLFVKDTSKFWYKPDISREEAIAILKDKPPGTFVVRDSNSFPGAFGLALKVATPPPNVQNSGGGRKAVSPGDPTDWLSSSFSSAGDSSSELVRHFLIEPTSKGVRLKGCANEPVFGSLSALVYQHSMTPLALPCKLILPESDPAGDVEEWQPGDGSDSTFWTQGAACNLLYLGSVDVESLTGSTAVDRALTRILDRKEPAKADVVHFKVSGKGITLTDNTRKTFFRRHYPLAAVSHCGLDPRNRKWSQEDPEKGVDVASGACFGFVAKKKAGLNDNQCHLLAELEKEQPASAILDFVRKVMSEGRSAKSEAM